MKCEWEHEVSDAEFGYWNSAWGDPPIHTFTCDEPAVAVVETPDYGFGTDRVALCISHLPLGVE